MLREKFNRKPIIYFCSLRNSRSFITKTYHKTKFKIWFNVEYLGTENGDSRLVSFVNFLPLATMLSVGVKY